MTTYSSTNLGFLERLRKLPPDEEAWREFTAIHQPRIYARCRARQLDHPNAEELTVTILSHLSRKLPNFVYNKALGGFHRWLAVVVSHAIQDHFRIAKENDGAGGNDNLEVIHQLPDLRAPDLNALSSSITNEFYGNKQFRLLMLLGEALERVKKNVRLLARWEAFVAIKMKGQSSTEVGKMHGKSRAWADVAGREIQRMVAKELEIRLKRLLAATHNNSDKANEELVRYAGMSEERMNKEAEWLLKAMRRELEQLLEGLTNAACHETSVSQSAKKMGMPPSDLSQLLIAMDNSVEAESEQLDEEDVDSASSCSSDFTTTPS